LLNLLLNIAHTFYRSEPRTIPLVTLAIVPVMPSAGFA
jgi:hypothetical protein